MDQRFIYEQNPWWADRALIGEDRALRQLEAAPFQWVPSVKAELALDADFAVHVLRGPRQVGKTTLLKSIIRELLDEGGEPRSIFYVSLDLATGLEDIVDSLDLAVQATGSAPRYVFLDEITFIRDWQRALKYAVDSGRLDHCVVVLIGSSAWDLRRGTERLPGRRGKGLDLELRPMSFSEFVETTVGLNVPRRPLDELWSDPGCMLGHLPLLQQLQTVFADYLKCGGLPLATADHVRAAEIEETTFDLYHSAIAGEVQKWGKDVNLVRELLGALCAALASPVSWETLANRTKASSSTVREYVDFLRDSFLIEYLYALDRNTLAARPKKAKKHYLADPFLVRVCSRWVGAERRMWESTEDVGRLVENVVAAHLARCCEGLYYYHSAKGREIDFVALGESPMPVEVKYQGNVNGWDEQSIKKTFARGLILTRDTAQIGEVSQIPASLFLASLEL